MLLHIERTVGGVEAFSPYHKDFIKEFSGKSIGTEDWRRHFEQYWAQFPEKEAAIKKNVDLDVRNRYGSEIVLRLILSFAGLAQWRRTRITRQDGIRHVTRRCCICISCTLGQSS